jgi:2'-5' RNA ligase
MQFVTKDKYCMKNYTQFLESTINEGNGPYEYGCAMLFLNAPEIEKIQESIDPSDLSGSGLEKEHHVTLLYGIHSNEVSEDEVFKACEMTPHEVRLHNISLFENKEYDVLKFDADCPELQKANARLVKLPHTTDYPDYHPHATIAYLKPGTGSKYVKALMGVTAIGMPDKIVYSKPDGKKVEKKLTSAETN